MSPDQTQNREDYLESAYWYFDECRRSIGERLAFKASLRGEISKYARKLEDDRVRLPSLQDVARMVDENLRLQNLNIEVINLLIQHIEDKPTLSLWEIVRKLSDGQTNQSSS